MGVYSNNPDYWNGGRSSGSRTERSGDVEVSGVLDNNETLGRIMTTNPYMAEDLKAFIRKCLREARNNLSKDVKNYLKEDPRKAARAVRYLVYKSLFGGNLSILQKKGAAGARYQLIRQKKLQPGQRGGNRRPRVEDARNRLETYYGADRGFVLRFITSGTRPRFSARCGNRGMIPRTDWFGHTAPWQLETAAEKVAEVITEYVNKQKNG